MTYFYLSKCYHNKINAGNKAKTDIENVLSSLGYKNAGLPQLVHSSAIFDHLSASVNQQSPSIDGEPTRVMYAGALSYQKNKYLYTLSNVMSQWRFELYGGGFEAEQVKSRELFCYRGFVSSDQLIEQTNTCSGNFGE